MKESIPQRGGCSDLDALWDELAHWPGYYVTRIISAQGSGSHDREDRHRPDAGWFRWQLAGWCIEVEQEGWEPRDRWLMWGDSIADTARRLADDMAQHRADPHLRHIEDHAYVRACAQCATDAGNLRRDDGVDVVVEWSDPRPFPNYMPAAA